MSEPIIEVDNGEQVTVDYLVHNRTENTDTQTITLTTSTEGEESEITPDSYLAQQDPITGEADTYTYDGGNVSIESSECRFIADHIFENESNQTEEIEYDWLDDHNQDIVHEDVFPEFPDNDPEFPEATPESHEMRAYMYHPSGDVELGSFEYSCFVYDNGEVLDSVENVTYNYSIEGYSLNAGDDVFPGENYSGLDVELRIHTISDTNGNPIDYSTTNDIISLQVASRSELEKHTKDPAVDVNNGNASVSYDGILARYESTDWLDMGGMVSGENTFEISVDPEGSYNVYFQIRYQLQSGTYTRDSESVQLDSGAHSEGQLFWQTDSDDLGVWTVEISSEDKTDSIIVEIV